MSNKEKTKVLNLSLTSSEIKTLEEISKELFGKENKSGMVRYWITQALKNAPKSVVANGGCKTSEVKGLININFKNR